MAPDYLARLMMQRSQARMIWFDEQAVPGSVESDLDQSLAGRFLRGDQPKSIQFRKLKLLVQDDDDNTCLSIAGALMATQSPQQWLPDAYIQAICYSGEHRDADDQLDATRNQLITTLLARCPVSSQLMNSQKVERAMMMDKRGEGVPVIMHESETLSGRFPEYVMVGEELQLTVFAASST